ncbi:MAG: hypothetical protein QM504_07030 [Pseudomonadota bacterium]
MSIIKHDFTAKIIAILNANTGGKGDELLKTSEIIQYLNIKTKAANIIEEIILQSRVEFNVEAEKQDILAFEQTQTNSN